MSQKVDENPPDVVLAQEEAKRLVGDPALRETFETLKNGYRRAWEATRPNETEKRELAYSHFKAVADVWAALERRAQGAAVREMQAALADERTPKCPHCGVSAGQNHREDCLVMVNHRRTQALANG